MRLRVPAALLMLAVVATVSTPPSAQAQGASPTPRNRLSEGDFLLDIPPVVTASRLPQLPQDAPGVVTVLDRQFIESVGARDVAELLRFVPGFFLGVPRGGQPVVAYHGLSSQIAQRVQVIVDGRSLYAPYLFGGIDWSALNIDVSDIDRIEVVRGSNSSTFGANAFLGVVSITTRTAAQAAGFGVQWTRGNNGIQGFVARWGAIGPGWGFRLTGGSRADDGLNGLADQRRREHLDAQGQWQLNGRDELIVQAGAVRSSAGLGFPRQASDPERRGLSDSQFGLIRLNRVTGHNQMAILTLSHTVDRGADRFDLFLTPRDTLTVDYARRAERTALDYWQTFAWSNTTRAVWGLELRRDSVRAPQLFNTSEWQGTHSLRGYANGEWQPSPRLTLNVGASVENEAISGQQFAPRGFINFKLAPGHTLKLGNSSALRTPSLFEQRSDWRLVHKGTTLNILYLSSGKLVPERIEATELVYQGQWDTIGLTLDTRLFRERVRDLITSNLRVLPPGPGVAPGAVAYDLRNRGQLDLDGLEYRVQWSPSWRANLTLSQFHRLKVSADQLRLSQSVPERAGSAIVAFNFTPEWSASLSQTWHTGLTWIDESTPADPQIIRGARLAWRGPAARGIRTEWAFSMRRVDPSRFEFRELQGLRQEGWLTVNVSY